MQKYGLIGYPLKHSFSDVYKRQDDEIYSETGKLPGTEKDAGDYKWIKLQRTTAAQTLAKYREKGTTPIYLYDLKKDMESRGAD